MNDSCFTDRFASHVCACDCADGAWWQVRKSAKRDKTEWLTGAVSDGYWKGIQTVLKYSAKASEEEKRANGSFLNDALFQITGC